MMKKKVYSILIFLYYVSSATGFSQGVPGITIGGVKNEVGLSICPSYDSGYVIAGSTRSGSFIWIFSHL